MGRNCEIGMYSSLIKFLFSKLTLLFLCYPFIICFPPNNCVEFFKIVDILSIFLSEWCASSPSKEFCKLCLFIIDTFILATEYGVCIASGDPHYKTYDDLWHDFQGSCQYILSEDCTGNTFSVEVKNQKRSQSEAVSFTSEVIVTTASQVMYQCGLIYQKFFRIFG